MEIAAYRRCRRPSAVLAVAGMAGSDGTCPNLVRGRGRGRGRGRVSGQGVLSGRCRARREMTRGAISAEIDRGHAICTYTHAHAHMHIRVYAQVRTAPLPCPARHRRHGGQDQEGSAGRPGARRKRYGAVASVGLGLGVLWAKVGCGVLWGVPA